MKWVKGGVKIYVIVFILVFIFAISAVVLTPFICSGAEAEDMAEALIERLRDSLRFSNEKDVKEKIEQTLKRCVCFNPKTAKISSMGKYWIIGDRKNRIFSIGFVFGDRQEAERALRIIKHYGMNKACFVGKPPSFKFLLVSGRAPVGPFRGEDCIKFNPNRLKVKKINKRWHIVEGNYDVIDFGPQKSEALAALGFIKYYGFSHICFVGRPGPSFEYPRK